MLAKFTQSCAWGAMKGAAAKRIVKKWRRGIAAFVFWVIFICMLKVTMPKGRRGKIFGVFDTIIVIVFEGGFYCGQNLFLFCNFCIVLCGFCSGDVCGISYKKIGL